MAFATHDMAQGGASIFFGNNQAPLVPAPNTVRNGSQSVTLSERGGERFSSFVVPVDDIITSNPNPQSSTFGPSGRVFQGYLGNPRLGKCTYPTITWSMKSVSQADSNFFYGNLNTNNVITLNQS